MPETEVDLQKKYDGKGAEVSWVKKESGNGHAVFDLNKLIAPHKGAVLYAYREFDCEKDQSLEIRLGTPNGWKLWVNSQLVFAHEEYHLTMRMDQYRVPVTLKAGINRILLKICQDEQSVEWCSAGSFNSACATPQARRFCPRMRFRRSGRKETNEATRIRS